jgi:hypothetical protein
MTLFFGLFFGAIGGAYMLYGKRTTSLLYVVFGVLLAIYPYFVENVWLTVLIGLVLIAAPIAINRGLV